MHPALPPAHVQAAPAPSALMPAAKPAPPVLKGTGAAPIAASRRIAVVGFRVAFVLEETLKASTKQAHQRSNGDWVYPVFHNVLVGTAKAEDRDLQNVADRIQQAFLQKLRATGREVVDLGLLPAEGGSHPVRIPLEASTIQVWAPAPHRVRWEPEDPVLPLPSTPEEQDSANRALAEAASKTGEEPCSLVSVTLTFRVLRGSVKQMKGTWLENQPNNALTFHAELALIGDRTSVLVLPVERGQGLAPVRVRPVADRPVEGVFYKNPDKVAEWSGKREKAKGWFRTIFMGGMDKWSGSSEETKYRSVGLEVDPGPFSKACLRAAEALFDDLLPPRPASSRSQGGGLPD